MHFWSAWREREGGESPLASRSTQRRNPQSTGLLIPATANPAGRDGLPEWIQAACGGAEEERSANSADSDVGWNSGDGRLHAQGDPQCLSSPASLRPPFRPYRHCGRFDTCLDWRSASTSTAFTIQRGMLRPMNLRKLLEGRLAKKDVTTGEMLCTFIKRNVLSDFDRRT